MTTATSHTTVAADLAARIRRDGPIPLPDFMAAVTAAYYGKGDVFGREGDFITAPEISQVFGELIGLWCAVVWERMGRPNPFRLVECGPGRGTLMADCLRAAGRMKGFVDSADIHLVEQSAALRARQRETLSAHRITWHDRIEDVPRGPLILVANEFLDALPIRQHIKEETGWRERYVALASDGDDFIFIDQPSADGPINSDAPAGTTSESSPALETFTRHIADRVVVDGGVALLIDYGHDGTDFGDTLQAVKQHKFHPVLSEPGTADITAHVNFGTVASTATDAGAKVYGPEPQGTWLAQLGIGVRVTQLTRGQPAARAAEIAAGVRRLTTPDGMGLLFKVIALAHPTLAPLDGFAQDTAE